MTEEDDDLRCENDGCGKLVECFVCETCAQHYALHDPEACWESHEAWRLGNPKSIASWLPSPNSFTMHALTALSALRRACSALERVAIAAFTSARFVASAARESRQLW